MKSFAQASYWYWILPNTRVNVNLMFFFVSVTVRNISGKWQMIKIWFIDRKCRSYHIFYDTTFINLLDMGPG